MRKIKHKSNKTVEVTPAVKENPTSWTGFFKNYPRIIGMFILLLFLPPIGWIFAYKFSPYDKRTTIGISVLCTAFFVYAVFISPEHSFIDTAKLSRADFCTRYNEQAAKLAPKLGINLDENNLSVDGDNFSYKITDAINFDAQIKNNFVKEISVTAEPKNTDDSFQAINTFGLVIATLSPELNQDKRGEILRELKMLETNISGDLNASTVSGRITYGVKSSAGKIIFTARINDDF